MRATVKEQGGFLTCLWRPEASIDIARLDDEGLFVSANVLTNDPLGDDLRRVRLIVPGSCTYRAGQFINVRSPDGLLRSYSIASVPDQEPWLELHVRRLQNGRVSRWIHDDLKAGDTLPVEGPHGDCVYLPGRPDSSLLLIGTGSGAAPLWGIARDALAHGHQGDIHVYHGSSMASGLYLDEAFCNLAKQHAGQFHYVGTASRDDTANARRGRAEVLALADHPKLEGWRVFLCGHPEMVRSARKKTYLAGAAMQDIHADPFELKDLRTTPR